MHVSDGEKQGWGDQRNEVTGGDTGEEKSQSIQEELSETSEKAGSMEVEY